MKKIEIEKSLKRYLKRKIKYSFSLLITFLITGWVSFASELTQEELLTKIKKEKDRLEELLEKNKRSINQIRKENLKMVKEADYYIKPEKGLGVSFIAEYKDSHSVEKDWKGSIRKNTLMDERRDGFNKELYFQSTSSTNLTENEKLLLEAAKYSHTVDKRSSGWLNMNPNYASNTTTYDAEARLFILPTLNPPTVRIPVEPSVSKPNIAKPEKLKILPPSILNVAVGTINLNTPTVSVPSIETPSNPSVPIAPSVMINEPNINIVVGAINVGEPGELNVPNLSAPVVKVDVDPNVPPKIVPPNPEVIPPDSPQAPNFEVYIRKRGNWLGSVGGQKSPVFDPDPSKNYAEGYNNFDRRIQRFVRNTKDNSSFNTTINDAPFFNINGTISGKGKDVSKVIATTEIISGKKIITNKYNDIKADVDTYDFYPNNRWFQVRPADLISKVPFKGVAKDTYVSAEDDGQGEKGRLIGLDGTDITDSTKPNEGKNSSNHYSRKQQQGWIFQGAPTLVKDMTIEIGGGDNGTAIFAQSRAARMENVQINLKGKTTIADIDIQDPYEVKLKDTDISIQGNYNTVLSLSSVTINSHSYPSNSDSNKSKIWGKYEGDNNSKDTTIELGTLNIEASTSNNAILYVIPSSIHRWNGLNESYTDSKGTSYQQNPRLYHMYYPVPGNVKVKNEGTFTFTGSGNAVAWLNGFIPNRKNLVLPSKHTATEDQFLDLGKIKLLGDNNVGYYFADDQGNKRYTWGKDNPAGNAIFQGKVTLNVEMGTSLDGGTGSSQIGTGNSTGNSANKSEKNVAIYIASGQRKELNKLVGTFAQYYPATLSFKVDTVTYPEIVGIETGSDIGAYQLGTHTDIKDPIKNFDLSDYQVKFGKYSKNSIAVVAKNGSVIDLGSRTATITDEADIGAEENILAYAEGLWHNPRKKHTSTTYDAEAYARGESITGRKYISDFGSTINIKKDILMKSVKSTALFAKSGAKIDSETHDVTMEGHSAKAVLAHGTYNYAAGKIVDSDNSNANVQPNTSIIVRNIEAKADGSSLDEKNNNIAAAAISKDTSGNGEGKVSVVVKGKVDVSGVGAFARGKNATVTIEGNNSIIKSGKNAGLVAKDGGTINFGGGVINHDVEDAAAFFSEKTDTVTSKLNFKGSSTLNISKGIVFFGEKKDYSANNALAGETGRYTGMSNLTVNLTGNGVNLGLFEGADAIWDGTDAYLNGLKLVPKVADIRSNSKWYKSSLEGSKLTVKTDVNRDNISSGDVVGDRFNDIVAERTKVIFDKNSSGNKIEVKSVAGRGLLMASNSMATTNKDSGYIIKNATLDINNGTAATTGVYVNFGHINIEKEGAIKVSKGVGAYGVNGSEVVNEGSIEIVNSDSVTQGVGIAVLAEKENIGESGIVQDTYGKVANSKVVTNWGTIKNTGSIKVNGTDGIGIYLKNKLVDTTKDIITRINMQILNKGTIEVGENGKGIVIESSRNQGGNLTLEDSGTGQDIKVGKKGIGIYAEHSNITLNSDYGISVKENGVAIYTTGNTVIHKKSGINPVLTVEYKGLAGGNNTALALAYKADGGTSTGFENNINIKLLNTGEAGTLVGLYADGLSGKKLKNNGNIEAKHTGTYGILSKGIDVTNTGKIVVGDNNKNPSEAVGIYVENASLITDGDKIEVSGNGSSSATPIGIYAKANASLTTNKSIVVNKGTAAMEIGGKNTVGIYLQDQSTDNQKLSLNNKSDIVLMNSATVSQRKIGILLKNSKNMNNETSGNIEIGKNNIGIYNNNSTLTHSGKLEVKYDEDGTENIGVHNTGDKFVFKIKNTGVVDVEGRNATIGISAITNASETGKIELENAQIKVKASSLDGGKIPLGIYVKGNNIEVNTISGKTSFLVTPNAVGAYLEGNSTTKFSGNKKFNLSSENTKDRLGVGAYFKSGAYAFTNSMTNEEIEVESTLTANNANGAIRPIGLFYGEGSTKNEADLKILANSKEVIGMFGRNLNFENKGKLNVAAKGIGAYFSGTNFANKGEFLVTGEGGYGLYLQGGTSYTEANMKANGKSSIAVLVSGIGAKFENKASTTISAEADKAVGVYVEKNGEFTNTGILKSDISSNPPTISGSIAAFALKGSIRNNGLINSKNVALYGTETSNITNSGNINVIDGVGILANKNTEINALAGEIKGTTNNSSGIIAQDNSTVNFSGTNVLLSGSKSIGLSVNGGSKAILVNGSINVGEEGLGVYSKSSSVDLNSYKGSVSLGNKGIGIYAENSSIRGKILNLNYKGTTDIGVGIYYKNLGNITNETEVKYTGKKFVNIYSDGAKLKNTAAQTVKDNGIAIYAKGGELYNTAILTLEGDKTVGMFLDDGAKLTSIGTVIGGTAANYKIGIYAKNGSIEGTEAYNFSINNGVAMYLADNGINNYTGTLNLSASSQAGKRAIGIYTTKSPTLRNINTNIKLSGKDAIGMFLEGDGTQGSKINYGGTLDIISPSTSDYGIGALVQNKSKFTLTSSGTIKIHGSNNIGFYVQEGGELDISGGKVENNEDGLFAYLDKGKLSFTKGATPSINFLNVFVNGVGGELKNSTKILVGTKGLQVAAGAKIENTKAGEINAKVEGARALVGTGNGTKIENSGTVKLLGDKSVAVYVTDNAEATSSGLVEVGKKSVAYYAKDNALINVSGSIKIGEGSSMFYVDKGRINYTGTDIVLDNDRTALTLIGSPAKVNFNNRNLTVGKNGVGLYLMEDGEINLTNKSVENLAKIKVKNGASGIYIANSKNFESNFSIDLIEENSIGLYRTGNGNITYSGLIESSHNKVKGIVNVGAGNTLNNGTLKLSGAASIGIYAENGGVLRNSGSVEVAKGLSGDSAVAVYGKNLSEIRNTNKIKIQENAIGIYGENTKIINTGKIQNSGLNNNGIYAIESKVENTGDINLGDSSNGIYAQSLTGKVITNKGNIKVGGGNSSAIFAAGNTKLINNSGTLTTGKDSVGLATIAGDIEVEAASKFNIGESSIYIYSKSGRGVNRADINLSKYSVAMFSESGKMINDKSTTIRVGESLITNTETKMSVAMATEVGEIENRGTLKVHEKWGVGMSVTPNRDKNPGTNGKAINKGIIEVNGELAYGMIAANEATLENEGTILINGKKARGMAATKNSKIINHTTGVITVKGEEAQGVYVDSGSTINNLGIINVEGSDRVGIFSGGGNILNSGTINVSDGATPTVDKNTSLEVGKLKIKGPKVIFDGVEVLNSGVINIPEALDMGTIKVGTTIGHIGTINSKTFGKGEFIVLPNSTLGTNKDTYTIQYLGGFKNIPNNGELTAISHSVSFIADIQNDITDPLNPKARIILARIPYSEMLADTKAVEFGKGLEELYKNLSNKSPKAPEYQIFDALKMIANKDELGSTFDKELRGNVYANVQKRILDIGETFTTSYNNLRNNELYAKNRFKVGAIVTSGKTKDENAGVENYKLNTLGTILMYEKDHIKYGRNTNISFGFTENKFDFDLGSKEKVYSLHLGLGYEDLLLNNNFRYSTRAQFTLNRHDTRRKINLSNGTFENRAKYWSEMLEWKNTLRYEFPTLSGKIKAGVFGTFDLAYGKFNDINESGDGIELRAKSENIHSIKPGIGADLTLAHYTKNGKLSLVGTATAEYELGEIYDGANQAKIKNSSAAYYDLEKAKEIKNIYKIGAQLQYVTNSGHKFGISVVREEGSIKATKYGINLMYKF